jgi:hypothetical protein
MRKTDKAPLLGLQPELATLTESEITWTRGEQDAHLHKENGSFLLIFWVG